ncbi:MAG: VanZ family protein [Gemmatimonadaceae bacterium]|nr:VanZ family protein [Gemmatimonadaceae bacterium]
MAATPQPFRFRRAADFTALRLGRAILGYLALMTGIITLAPFEFQSTPAHGLTTVWNWSDLIMNVVMFVPFGFAYQLTRPRGAPPDWPRVVVLGAALSGAIELAQLFSPQRYTSLLDLGTNTLGAAVGAGLFARLARHLPDDTTVRSLALELPLMGLVYQLVPLTWLVGLGAEDTVRRWLVLIIATMAGAIVGTVHAAYVAPQHPRGARGTQRWLWGTLIGWAVVALPPALRDDAPVISAALVLLTGSAVLRSIATIRRSRQEPSGRFELPTLRLVMPLFAAYLTLSALWPIANLSPDWQGTWLLVLPVVELSQPLVFRALEQVAAFTLVGYLSAEYHGRDWRTLSLVWPRLLAWSLPVALLLQAARGWRADSGASVSLLVLTQVAAMFGGWLYVLQRAHVQALVARRALLSALPARDTTTESLDQPGS